MLILYFYPHSLGRRRLRRVGCSSTSHTTGGGNLEMETTLFLSMIANSLAIIADSATTLKL